MQMLGAAALTERFGEACSTAWWPDPILRHFMWAFPLIFHPSVRACISGCMCHMPLGAKCNRGISLLPLH